jgi:hypothetical protein
MLACTASESLSSAMLAAPQALDALRWVHLEVSHQLQAPLTLEAPFALGALYRSVFGLALSRRSGPAFELFFGGHDEAPRPWWWWPPEVGTATRLPEGAVLVSRLTLQASALSHLDACLVALADFHTLGLGARRAPALLTNVRVLAPWGPVPLDDKDPPCWHADALWQAAREEAIRLQEAQQEEEQARAVQVRACTPLHLKEDGRALRCAPALDTLVRRSMARAHLLLAPSSGALLHGQDKADWLDHCSGVAPHGVQLACVRVPRYSARQGRALHIEGVAGHWSYGPAALAALPWLRLAEHLQLGGKTTLGFGALKVDSSAQPPWLE